MTVMRGKAWLVLAVLAFGCAKAERSAEPSSQPAPPPARAERPGSTEVSAPTASSTLAPSEKPGLVPESGAAQRKAEHSDALREVQTLAQAEAALKQAESELDALLGPRGRTADKGGAVPLAAGDARCGDACKAFESLRRAAEAVCRLAGDADARCTRARKIVKENERRVSVCKCEPANE
jgi:hypothetical protein